MAGITIPKESGSYAALWLEIGAGQCDKKNHQAYGKKAEIGGLPPIPDTTATVIYIEWQ